MFKNAEKKIPNLTASVIAGGKSTRFGDPKALEQFRSRELVDYATDLAKAISEHQILVYGEENLFAHKDIICIPDLVPDCGPLGGIYSALKYASNPWIAAIPCDMPHLAPEIYGILAKYRPRNRPVVAVSPEGMESIVSIWPRSLIVKIEEAIHRKEFALHTALKKFDSVEVPFPKAIRGHKDKWFFNINSRADL